MLELDQHRPGARGRRAPAPRRRRARRPHEAAPPAGRAPAALLPAALRREPHPRGEDRAASTARTTTSPPTTTRTRSSPSGAARRCSSSATGNTYLEAALLLDEYLDVTDVAPAGLRRRRSRSGDWDAVIFDGVTPAEPPQGERALPRSARARLAGEGRAASSRQPGFDKIDRKHPVGALPRARRRERRATGHKLVPQTGRQGRRRVRRRRVADPRRRDARRLQVRRARASTCATATCRCARVAALRPRLHQLVHRRGRAVPLELPHGRGLAHPGAGERRAQATVKLPDGSRQPVAVHEGRAVLLGEHAGFYELDVDADAAGAPASGRAARRVRREPARRRREHDRARRTSSSSTASRGRRASTGSTSACGARSGSTCSSRPRCSRRSSGRTYHRRVTV